MRRRKEREEEAQEKVLDVDASMQGTLTFKDPVNLRINGKFDGKLVTKGTLIIGEHATVNADIDGEAVSVAGKVTGDIVAHERLQLVSPAYVAGNVRTPVLNVESGARLNGNCKMDSSKDVRKETAAFMTADEVARYLEVDTAVVSEWATKGRIPAVKEANAWKIDRKRLDEWIVNGKIK